MDTRLINHRRNRQQTRRVLAEIRVRGRDLTGSFFRTEIDLSDQPANDNDEIFIVDAAERLRR